MGIASRVLANDSHRLSFSFVFPLSSLVRLSSLFERPFRVRESADVGGSRGRRRLRQCPVVVVVSSSWAILMPFSSFSGSPFPLSRSRSLVSTWPTVTEAPRRIEGCRCFVLPFEFGSHPPSARYRYLTSLYCSSTVERKE